MKKLLALIIVAIAALLCAGHVSAQHNFGVMGGVTFSYSNVKELNDGPLTQYHAGLTYRARLPMGFSIQPSLLYHAKGSRTSLAGVELDTKVGYLELPVSFQWGPDLILFRPFVDVTPFAGYAVKPSSGFDRWEYGVGAGLGFDIWRFQFITRYNWGSNFRGVTLSLAYLF